MRCRQSVEPLAAFLGLPIEERPELAEGVSRDEPWALVEELGSTIAVLCSHGDILGFLWRGAAEGFDLDRRRRS